MSAEEGSSPKKKLNPYLRFGGMVFQMLSVILLGALLGNWLDRKLNTPKPYYTLGCAFIGVILSMVLIIRDIKKVK